MATAGPSSRPDPPSARASPGPGEQPTKKDETRASMERAADFRRMSIVIDSLATIRRKSGALLGEPADISDEESLEKLIQPPQPQRRGKNLDERILDGAGPFRRAAFEFVESRFFSTFILIVILLNTVTLILKCFKYISINSGIYMVIIENVFLGIYLTEATMKLIAYKHYYFYSIWNDLDFFIIVNNLVEFVLPLILETGEVGSMGILRLFRVFKAIRALRALRVLRTIRFLSSLNVILTTMFESVQSIGSIVVLMLVVMYMFSVMGKSLFESVDPVRFGSLWKTFVTLFQLLTLDDWFFIYTENGLDTALFFYLFFYIVIEYFVFLNLFVAVLLDNFQLTLEVSTQERKRARNAMLQRDLHDSDAEEEEQRRLSTRGEWVRETRRRAASFYPQGGAGDGSAMERYLQLLPALERQLYLYQRQQSLIDRLVDQCVFEEAANE